MSGFDRLYEEIYKARPKAEEPFFLGNVTGEDPIEISAFGLPLPEFQTVFGLPELRAGDMVIGAFIGGEAFILGVL